MLFHYISKFMLIIMVLKQMLHSGQQIHWHKTETMSLTMSSNMVTLLASLVRCSSTELSRPISTVHQGQTNTFPPLLSLRPQRHTRQNQNLSNTNAWTRKSTAPYVEGIGGMNIYKEIPIKKYDWIDNRTWVGSPALLISLYHWAIHDVFNGSSSPNSGRSTTVTTIIHGVSMDNPF